MQPPHPPIIITPLQLACLFASITVLAYSAANLINGYSTVWAAVFTGAVTGSTLTAMRILFRGTGIAPPSRLDGIEETVSETHAATIILVENTNTLLRLRREELDTLRKIVARNNGNTGPHRIYSKR